jgi:hypothetical protein
VAIPYPISNQEFYNGSTGVDKSKKRFDFEAEISNYKSSELEQLIGSSARIKKWSCKYDDIESATMKKSKIEYYKQVKVSDYLKTIVSLYNEGLDLNRFISIEISSSNP